MQVGALPAAVRMRAIRKSFGGLEVLAGVDLDIPQGSVHAIVGENGAGKSTLMNILYGFYVADEGEIEVLGQKLQPGNTLHAIHCGVGMVHQHQILVDRFTALENIVLGTEKGWRLDRSMAEARSCIGDLSQQYGLQMDLDARTGDLSVGALQRLEILRALHRGARVLILDEPTAVLTPDEVQGLGRMMRRLKSDGATVIVITHKLAEVKAFTDRVSVMRGGRLVAEAATADVSIDQLAEWMIGRRQIAACPSAVTRRATTRQAPAPRLRAVGLGWRDGAGVARVRDVNLTLTPGRIVGVAGVSGNGQSELLQLLAGVLVPSQGEIRLKLPDGSCHRVGPDQPANPRRFQAWGVAHVPEDRIRHALVPAFAAWETAALGRLRDAALRYGPLLNLRAMKARCRNMMSEFAVVPADESLGSSKFSGGNQQKLVMAREIGRAPVVMLAGQPTRGVDIGAIEVIHRHLRVLRNRGCAVLLVSADLDELLALADTILVMSAGRVVGELAREDATPARLGRLMGHVDHGADPDPAPPGAADPAMALSAAAVNTLNAAGIRA